MNLDAPAPSRTAPVTIWAMGVYHAYTQIRIIQTCTVFPA